MPEFEKVLDLPRVRDLPRRTMRASAFVRCNGVDNEFVSLTLAQLFQVIRVGSLLQDNVTFPAWKSQSSLDRVCFTR